MDAASERDAATLYSLMIVISNRLSGMVSETTVPRLLTEDPELWNTVSKQLKSASYLAHCIRRRSLGLQA